jgi:soluble lytic murein transglycosylase-like protein
MRPLLGALALLLALAPVAGRAAEAADPELKALLQRAVESSDSFVDRFEAEVWLSDMDQRLAKHRPALQPAERLELLKLVHREATRAAISPELVLAVIDIESRFDRYAISSVGAQGLMQVMPFWLKEIGHPEDNLFDAPTNLRMGCTILKYYLDKSRGEVRHALNRYNGTRKRKYSDKVLTVLSTRWYKS